MCMPYGKGGYEHQTLGHGQTTDGGKWPQVNFTLATNL